jgi:hypothetical protein
MELRLSLRIGHGGQWDGWNAALSSGHELAVGSGQRLRFVAVPLRNLAFLLRRETFRGIAVVGSVYWAWTLP